MSKPFEAKASMEGFLRELFPNYWHTLEKDEDGCTLRFDYDPAEPIFDRLIAAGFVEDKHSPNVDADLRDGYQSTEHLLEHPVHGQVVFCHSMSWTVGVFELSGATSDADELTWEVHEPEPDPTAIPHVVE